MAGEEYIYKFSMMQQEAEKIEEQINAVNQQMQELEKIKTSVENLENEVLAPLGRGIFFKAEKKEDSLYVNVGENIVVKKSRKDTSELIQQQMMKLAEMKNILLSEIEKINLEMQEIIADIQSKK